MAIVGFFVIPLLTFGGFLGWRSSPSPKVLLLIANFDGVDPQKYQVTENILRNLRNATEPYADVKVQALDKSITEQQGSEVARAEGEQKKAAIVIWGNYGVSADHVQISTHFEVLKPPTYFPELGKTAKGEAQTSAIAELNSFNLQTRLSNEMSYLTLFTLGMAQGAADNYDGAIARFSDALGQVETTISTLGQQVVYLYRGACYWYKNNYKNAIIDIDHALQLQPDYIEAYQLRGVIYAYQNNFNQAIADSDQAIQLKTDNAESYFSRGLVYFLQGNYTQAIADYTQAIKLKPDLVGAYVNRGNAYGKQENYNQAIADYTQALYLKPDDVDVYFGRASDYGTTGNYDQAIADYTQVLHLKPDNVDAHNNRGLMYMKQGKYRQAIADFNQAIHLNPEYIEAYNNRGLIYNVEGNYNQAIVDFNQALKLKPDLTQSYLGRGLSYFQLSNKIGAIQDFRKTLELTQDPVMRKLAEQNLRELGAE